MTSSGLVPVAEEAADGGPGEAVSLVLELVDAP